ncbi:MAG: hypothetical protein HWN66_19140 [Candidatus Helarchaeota archaeon]|nr:hypothetical protein [Candidatus Helarchaeota archaeon]
MVTILKEFQNEDQVIYKFVLIQGLKSVEIFNSQELIKKLTSINSKYDVTIQICSASLIVTWEHIFLSVLHAILAFNQKRNISNQLELEILLYISSQRQIKIALEDFGIKTGNNVIIIVGNSTDQIKQALVECENLLEGVRSDEVIGICDNSKLLAIREYFQISDEELNAIALTDIEDSQEDAVLKAVLNRIALVTLEK